VSVTCETCGQPIEKRRGIWQHTASRLIGCRGEDGYPIDGHAYPTDWRERIAAWRDDAAVEIMARHADYVSDFARHCTCGEWSDLRPEAQGTRVPFIHHVLAALALHGYALGLWSPAGSSPTAEEKRP